MPDEGGLGVGSGREDEDDDESGYRIVSVG